LKLGDAPTQQIRTRGAALSKLVVALCALVALALAASAFDQWRQREWLREVWLFKRPTGLRDLLACALLSCGGAVSALVALRRGRARALAAPALRWLPTLALATWIFSWTIEEPRARFDLRWLAFLAAAAWCTLVGLAAWPRVEHWPRALRTLELILATLSCGVLLAEVSLRVVRDVLHPRWLSTPGTSVDAWLLSQRLPPGSVHAGQTVNRDGYVDDEPDALGPDAPWVACVGDSFSVGAVPHSHHYTLLAEQQLGLPVYNVGVVHAGPREYLAMIEQHVLPRRPRLVVLAVFLGNDAEDAQRGEPSLVERLTSPEEALVLVAARRALARRAAGELGEVARAPQARRTGAEAERAMPWLGDPFLEPPTFDEQRFRYIEYERARKLLVDSSARLEHLGDWVVRIRAALGSTPLAVLLIPDEFQVDDALWREVLAIGLPADSERDRPQRELSARLAREGIEHLDLLPALRAVEPLRDGRPHVYHLRDTHFNARGNRVAARGLEELVRRFDLGR
jgi:hypothetical protein